ncbi:MAG: TlpA disulfide reductase family protein [bacterium]
MRIRSWIVVLTALALIFNLLAGCVQRSPIPATSTPSEPGASQPSEQPSASSGPQKGLLAPDFTGISMQGERISLSELRGGMVLINFWAIWCGPCIREIPELKAFYSNNKERVTVFSVEVDGARSDVEAFLQGTPLDYPVILDAEKGSPISSLYQINSIPATFIIDEQGLIVERIIGSTTERKLEAFLK